MATNSANNIYNIDPFAVPYGKTGSTDWELPFLPKPFSLVWGDPKYDNSHVYDVRDQTTWTAPDAYIGLRPKVAQDIEMKAYTDSNWYFLVMPIQQVSSENVSWESITYKAHLARPTPVLAPMPLVTSETFTNEATLIRLGMAYKIEHGFMNSPKAYQHHVNTLAQLANSVVEAVKLDILVTLMQAQNSKRNWAAKWGERNEENAKRVLQDQLDFWAILQRDKRAASIVDATINKRMAEVGGRADTYIVPQKVVDYLAIVPDEMLEQDKIGPTGPSIVLDGPRPYGVFNKNKIYQARAYGLTEDNRELLSSEEEIGEFYSILPRHITNTRGYTSKSRNILVYDEETDSNREISLTEALDNAYLFDKNGNPTFPDGPHHIHGDPADRDIFKYRDADGSVQEAYFFGEMEPKYFETSDKLQWAARAIDALAQEAGLQTEEISRAFVAGFTLLRRLEEIELNATDYEGRFDFTVVDAEGTGIPSVFAIKDVGRDPETDFLLEKDNAGVLENPIGGLQSLAGLRYIIKKNNEDAKSMPREAAVAREFVGAIETLVSVLDKYAPGSAFLSAKNASSIWHYPTPETTFFENLVMPYRPPLFTGDNPAIKTSEDAFQIYFQNPILSQLTTRADVPKFPKKQNPKLLDLLRYTMMLLAVGQLKDPDETKALEKVFAATVANNFGTAISRSNTAVSEISHVARELAKSDDFKIQDENQWKAIFDSLYPELQTAYTHYENRADDEQFVITELDVRLPVLVSPAAAAAIYNRLQDNNKRGDIKFWPANPNFPELPMTAEQLEAATLHVTNRRAELAARRLARANHNPAVAASFFVAAGQPHPVAATTFQAFTTATAIGHTLTASHFASNIRLGQQHQQQSIHAGFHEQHYSRIADEQQAMLPHLQMLDPSTRRSFSPEVERLQVLAGRMLSHTFKQSWDRIDAEASSPLERILAHVYDSIPITRKALDRFIQNNLIVPIGFLVARPHMRYIMLSLIKCLSGPEMGSTYVMPGQFELGDNAQIQEHFGSYTARAKAVVIHEQHVFVWKNAFSDGYAGGTNTVWIHPEAYKQGNYHGQSMICIPVPYRYRCDDALSLTGELAFGARSFPMTADGSPQYPTAPRVNALFGFRHAQKSDEYAIAPHGSNDSGRKLNMLCHPGQFMSYNEKEGEFNIRHRGRGHWKENTYPGCAPVRGGKMKRFKLPHYSNIIEV